MAKVLGHLPAVHELFLVGKSLSENRFHIRRQNLDFFPQFPLHDVFFLAVCEEIFLEIPPPSSKNSGLPLTKVDT